MMGWGLARFAHTIPFFCEPQVYDRTIQLLFHITLLANRTAHNLRFASIDRPALFSDTLETLDRNETSRQFKFASAHLSTFHPQKGAAPLSRRATDVSLRLERD